MGRSPLFWFSKDNLWNITTLIAALDCCQFDLGGIPGKPRDGIVGTGRALWSVGMECKTLRRKHHGNNPRHHPRAPSHRRASPVGLQPRLGIPPDRTARDRPDRRYHPPLDRAALKRSGQVRGRSPRIFVNALSAMGGSPLHRTTAVYPRSASIKNDALTPGLPPAIPSEPETRSDAGAFEGSASR